MSAAKKIEELEQRVAELEAERGPTAAPVRAAQLVRAAFGNPGAGERESDWTIEPEAPLEPMTEEQRAAFRLEALQRKYVKPLEREVERLKADLEAERVEQENPRFNQGFAWVLGKKEEALEAAEAKLAHVRALDLPAMAARIAEHETLNDPKVLAARIAVTVEKSVLAATLRREVYEEMQRHRAQLHADLCELANLHAQLDGLAKAKDYVGVSHRVGYAFDLLGPVAAQLDAQLPSEPGHTAAGEALRAKRAFALGLNNTL